MAVFRGHSSVVALARYQQIINNLRFQRPVARVVQDKDVVYLKAVFVWGVPKFGVSGQWLRRCFADLLGVKREDVLILLEEISRGDDVLKSVAIRIVSVSCRTAQLPSLLPFNNVASLVWI